MALPFISPTLIGLPRSLEGITPGQVAQTFVQASKSELFLMLGRHRVALPENAGLQPGQAVRVEVTRTPQGLQLRVMPESALVASSGGQKAPAGTEILPQPPTARTAASQPATLPQATSPRNPELHGRQENLARSPGTEPQSGQRPATIGGHGETRPANMPAAVFRILTDLARIADAGTLSRLAKMAGDPSTVAVRLAPLIPDGFATMPRLIQQLVMLWQPQSQPLAEDLAILGQLVREGVQAKVLPDASAQAALQLLAPISLQAPEGAAPQLAIQARTLPWEARLALLLRGASSPGAAELQAVFQEDARVVLQELRNNPAWLQFLRERGASKAFGEAAERVQEKLTATHLQNTRGQEAPYLFLEVPTPPGEGFRHARVHFFDGQSGQGREGGQEGAMVALDLELSALGKLWITLHFGGGACRCRILTEDTEFMTLFNEHLKDLEQRFVELYDLTIQVGVGLWDGDQLLETAKLMGRFGGLDVAG